nr:hypothetical protein [uncultured Roseateles sp.]
MVNHRRLFELRFVAVSRQRGQLAGSRSALQWFGGFSSVAGLAAALGRSFSLALPAAAPDLAFLWGIGFAHAGSVAALFHNVLVQLALLLANQSVKGTHNGEPSLRSLFQSVPPSCAPYLQR